MIFTCKVYFTCNLFSMTLLLISFIAGVLTVLAPCVLPLLPIIIGGSVQGGRKRNPYIITASLALAIVLFTLLLKFSTLFINIPQSVWGAVSGIIIIAFGLISLFPGLWDSVNIKLGLSNSSDKLLADSAQVKGHGSDILIGMSLGPVFSSCSPTYFLILATVLPRSLGAGIIYLIAYAIGLSLMLLLVSLLGRHFIKNARWAADPRGWFKRGLGILFLLVGVLILTGKDKDLQTYLVQNGYYPTSGLETSLLTRAQSSSVMAAPLTADPTSTSTNDMAHMNKPYPRYREISHPSGFVNTDPLTLEKLVGKKVILVDFMTYSCINCIRTFPYLNAWYDKYKDQDLEIVGIHTPEFAFEHKIENVRAAMERYGIKFPVVLDNDYGTWNAYGNNYWPRKYLIDIDGYVVYDHIGEGGYNETEKKIQELLEEKATRDKASVMNVPNDLVEVEAMEPARGISPETYFGSARNETFANGERGTQGVQTVTAPANLSSDRLYLDGAWNIQPEYAETKQMRDRVLYKYQANNIFFVGSASSSVKMIIHRDGKALEASRAGEDVRIENGESYVMIQEERLYHLLRDTKESGEHVLELIIEQPGVKAYTFTFG